MRNKKILIGFTILSIFALSLACGSMTKLMTLNFNQDILLSILDGVEVPDDQSSYSFTVSDLSIQQDYLRVEGEFNTETEAVSDVFIDFELSAEEGKLLFGIQNTNLSQIQAEEIVGNGIAKDLADYVYQYLSKDRMETEIIAVDFVDNVIRIKIRYLE